MIVAEVDFGHVAVVYADTQGFATSLLLGSHEEGGYHKVYLLFGRELCRQVDEAVAHNGYVDGVVAE